jgi:hypothetical protein
MHRLNGNNSNLDQKGQAVRLLRNHSIIFGPVTLKIGCLDAIPFTMISIITEFTIN